MTFSVAILAGGESSRMGAKKAFAEIRGKPLIEHVLARVNGLGQQETFVVANRPNDFAYLELPIHPDLMPDKGSLGGIYTALHHSQCMYTLTVACDMPFLNIALLQYMVGLCDNSPDIIAPRVNGHPQGLHAVYGKTCLPAIRQQLDADRLKVVAFYENMNVRYLDEPESVRLDSHLSIMSIHRRSWNKREESPRRRIYARFNHWIKWTNRHQSRSLPPRTRAYSFGH
jgi:molybdopterin-guanine dinucleotide biosynthesis protein A